MESFDYIVVGAGINGSWTAYHLAKLGHTVALLEKFPLPHSRGSSHGQSRIIRRAYPEPFFNHMMNSAYDQWHELEDESGKQLLVPMDLLCFGSSRGQFIPGMIQTLKEAKTQSEVKFLSHSNLEQQFPMIQFPENMEGLIDEEAGVLRADQCLQAIQARALALGVFIKDGWEVGDIQVVSPDEVKIIARRFQGQALFQSKGVVICPGPWASSILEKLGLKLPLEVTKIPVMYFPCQEFLKGPFVYDNDHGHFYGIPELEYPGMVKICRHDGSKVDPDHRDECDTSQVKTDVQDFIRKVFPTVDPKPCIEESCLYTVSPDGVPILDHHPKYRNIVFGCGFSGTGFKLGPVTGEILANMVTGRAMPFNLEPFKAERFACV